MHLAAGLWKGNDDMRVNKNIRNKNWYFSTLFFVRIAPKIINEPIPSECVKFEKLVGNINQ